MLYLVVGIDTESDAPLPSGAQPGRRFDNIAVLPKLHARLLKHRVRPTYLVTHPVAADGRSASVLREMRQGRDCEMGSLHHAWETPPIADGSVSRRPYARDLPLDQFAAQVTALTEAVTKAVGEPPLSYRSGRFGFSASHVPDLERAGYRIDSSVAPLLVEDDQGGPDFTNARPTPYFLAYDDPTAPGTSNLLELPLTTAFSPKLPRLAARLHSRALRRSGLRRALQIAGAPGVRWLRPADSTLDDMRVLARQVKQDGVPLLNLVLRSNDAAVGGGPGVRAPEALEQFVGRLEGVLTFIVNEIGAIPVTFSEFRALYCGTSRNLSAN